MKNFWDFGEMMRIANPAGCVTAFQLIASVLAHTPLQACSLSEECGQKWVALQNVGVKTSFFLRDSKPVLASAVQVGDILVANGSINVRSSPARWAARSFYLVEHDKVVVADLKILPAQRGRQQIWIRIQPPEESPPAGVDQHYVICTAGGGACPNADAIMGSQPTLQAIGDNMCAIYTERGKQIFPSEVKPYGGLQGYCAVTCHNMPQDSVVQWHPHNCMSEVGSNCTDLRDRFFECNDYAIVASQVCTQNGIISPYQFFKTSDFSSKKCGIIHLTVGCHVPAP